MSSGSVRPSSASSSPSRSQAMSRLSPRAAICLAGEAAEAALLALVLPLGAADRVVAEGRFEGGEVLGAQRPRLAEGGHVGAHVVDPDGLGVALSVLRAGEEDHVGLDALRIEDAGRQAQDGVQVAPVHQHLRRRRPPVLEQHVVRHDHGGAAAGLQRADDVLDKGELLVGGVGRHREVVARRAPPPFLVPKGGLVRIRSAGQRLRPRRTACRSVRVALDAVEHEVHEAEAMRVRHELGQACSSARI